MMRKLSAILCAICLMLLSFGFTACGSEKNYRLSVTGSECLYESLNDTYKAGEVVSVKVKIRPYEGVKASLGLKSLVKTKSDQDDFWLFTFEMPSHDATLDITSFEGFDEPLLYGFYLTFNDKDGNPIEEFNKDINSEEALADYYITYYNEEYGAKAYTKNVGANVFAEGKDSIGNNKVEIENTLYFTYELIDSVACVDFVYFDEKTQEIYSYGDAGYRLDDVGSFSLSNNQYLSDIRYNSQMKEYEEKFESNVKINFTYIDYLTGVKVLEYGADNQLIKSTELTKDESEETFGASEDCEYVVIEEEYTVMNDQANMGEKHIERTLINKGTHSGKILKYPRGDGLISPVYLSIGWKAESDH